MRVAWIVEGSIEQVSGGYIYDRAVVDGLRLLGDEVTIVEASSVKSRDLRGFGAVVGDELCFREVGPLFRELHGGPLTVLLVHHLTGWEHSDSREGARALEPERVALEAADLCIATSQNTAERLRREKLASEIVVVPPGADRLPRTPPRKEEGPVRLLYVGNFIPRKRLLELLSAFEEDAGEDSELVLVGDGTRDAAYAQAVQRAIAASPRLRGRVRITGLLAAPALARELGHADALVLPSAVEGYGMVLGEALHARLPFIAARVGAAEELVQKTGAGLLFDANAEGALGAALLSFVEDPTLRGKLRSAAAGASNALPRWRASVERFRATLQRHPG